MVSGPINSWQIVGKKQKQGQILFSWAPESLRMLTVAMKLKKMLAPWKGSYDKPHSVGLPQRARPICFSCLIFYYSCKYLHLKPNFPTYFQDTLIPVPGTVHTISLSLTITDTGSAFSLPNSIAPWSDTASWLVTILNSGIREIVPISDNQSS